MNLEKVIKTMFLSNSSRNLISPKNKQQKSTEVKSYTVKLLEDSKKRLYTRVTCLQTIQASQKDLATNRSKLELAISKRAKYIFLMI